MQPGDNSDLDTEPEDEYKQAKNEVDELNRALPKLNLGRQNTPPIFPPTLTPSSSTTSSPASPLLTPDERAERRNRWVLVFYLHVALVSC